MNALSRRECIIYIKHAVQTPKKHAKRRAFLVPSEGLESCPYTQKAAIEIKNIYVEKFCNWEYNADTSISTERSIP